MKQLLYISKIIGAVAVISGVVLGGYKIYYKLTKIDEKIDYISVEQSILNEDIQNINDSLIKITDHQKKQDQYMISMKDAAGFYIRNQQKMTTESMEEALHILLKKNDGWSLLNESPIPMNNYWMTYNNLSNQ